MGAHFWKRMPAKSLEGRCPQELSDLVPYWFDPEFPAERDGGLMVGVQNTGDLIATLLAFGSVGTGHEAAADIVAGRPADWDEEWAVGTIGAGDVRAVGAFLLDAPYRQWAVEHRATLAVEAESLGSQHPFDEARAAQVVMGARKLGSLFIMAAANDEAVIVKVSA